jgi:DNA-binding transcriptional LysR family regulator
MHKLHREGRVKELRQFVEVANQRSISGAAKRLNISQPALSRAIRQLEDTYGVPLFTRTGAGVELSAYGSALYSRAVRILPALDEARDEIEHIQGRAKAVIRIATGDLWGLVILPRIIQKFSKTHPDVLVEVKIADDGSRFEGLRRGVYDLVFGTLSYKYQAVMQVEFETLVRQGTFVYCDEEHKLANSTGIGVDHLLEQRWISPGYGDDDGPNVLKTFVRDFAVRADSMPQALLVLRGSPYVMAASSGFRDLFRTLGIVDINVGDHGGIQASGAIYTPTSVEKPVIRDFLRQVRAEVGLLKLPVLEDIASDLAVVPSIGRGVDQ